MASTVSPYSHSLGMNPHYAAVFARPLRPCLSFEPLLSPFGGHVIKGDFGQEVLK